MMIRDKRLEDLNVKHLAATELVHPNMLSVYDIGEENNNHTL